MEAVIILIAMFASFFGIAYIFFTTRNRERMALIEKGADASLFNTGKTGIMNFSWSRFSLKTGMFLMGIGLGIIAGEILDSLNVLEEGACYSSMIFFFGGLGLVVFYLVDRRNK